MVAATPPPERIKPLLTKHDPTPARSTSLERCCKFTTAELEHKTRGCIEEHLSLKDAAEVGFSLEVCPPLTCITQHLSATFPVIIRWFLIQIA